MKVLLINPPQENLLTVGIPSPVEKRGYYPTIGLLFVAAYCTQRTNHEISVLDAPLEKVSFDGLERIIREEEPDIVGISAMSFTLHNCVKTAGIVKKVSSYIPVVFGGIHVTLFPYESIGLANVDYAVAGEGEVALAELLNSLENKDELKSVKGLLYKENGNVVYTGPRPLIDDLDRLPFPERKLTPYKNFYSMRKNTTATTMITSRGCPYQCAFCIHGKKRDFRSRSPKNVVEEMKVCLAMGIGEFYIYDDTFTYDRERVLEICSRIINDRLNIEWSAMTRVDKVDYELMRRMKEAGCTRIRLGIEAGTDEIMEMHRKGTTVELAREAVDVAKAAGISTVAYFMLGAPTETKAQIEQTINFAQELNADFTHFSIVTLYPGTELYNQALESGLLKKDVWREFAKYPNSDFLLPLWEEGFSRSELMTFQSYAYRRFYFRPKFIIKKFSKVSTWRGFKDLVRLGFKQIRFWIAKDLPS